MIAAQLAVAIDKKLRSLSRDTRTTLDAKDSSLPVDLHRRRE